LPGIKHHRTARLGQAPTDDSPAARTTGSFRDRRRRSCPGIRRPTFSSSIQHSDGIGRLQAGSRRPAVSRSKSGKMRTVNQHPSQVVAAVLPIRFTGWPWHDEDRAAVLRTVPPAYAELRADHVTWVFQPALGWALPPSVAPMAIRVADNGSRVQAVVVAIGGSTAHRPCARTRSR
jgi:hypothetical protein